MQNTWRFLPYLLGLLAALPVSIAASEDPAKIEQHGILAELVSDDPDVRFLAALKLGEEKHQPDWAVRELARQLDCQDSVTLLPTRAALVHWGPRAIRVLLDELKSADPRRRAWALLALPLVALRATDAEAEELSLLIVPHAVRRANPTLSWTDAQAALVGLGPRAVPHIEAAILASTDPEHQTTLVEVLGRRSFAVPALIRLTLTDRAHLHAAVASVVNKWMFESDREAFVPAAPQFLSLLSSKTKHIARNAEEALIGIGPSALPATAAHFKQTTSAAAKVRCLDIMAHLVIYRTRGPNAKPQTAKAEDTLEDILILAARDQAETVRIAALTPLREGFSADVYVPVYRQLIADSSTTVRLETIRHIDDPRLLQKELEKAKDDEDLEVRTAATKKLQPDSGWMCPGVWDPKPSVLEKGLDWLDRQQQGRRWHFQTAESEAETNLATALATLCFLGSDRPAAPPQEEPRPWRESYAATNAMPHVLATVAYPDQDESSDSIKAKAVATLVFCETVLKTDDESYKRAAKVAIEELLANQNRETGGWGDKDDPDCSLWSILALRTAQMTSLRSDANERALSRSAAMFVELRDKDITDSVALIMNILAGLARDDRTEAMASPVSAIPLQEARLVPRDQAGTEAGLFAAILHGWQSTIDRPTSNASHDASKKDFEKFVEDSQVQQGREAGSWADSGANDRLRRTVFTLLTLEVAWQHMAVFCGPASLAGRQ